MSASKRKLTAKALRSYEREMNGVVRSMFALEPRDGVIPPNIAAVRASGCRTVQLEIRGQCSGWYCYCTPSHGDKDGYVKATA